MNKKIQVYGETEVGFDFSIFITGETMRQESSIQTIAVI